MSESSTQVSDAAVLEELGNIVSNAPVFAGDTVSHRGANKCVEIGWARRDARGDFVPTPAGELAAFMRGLVGRG